MMCLLFGHDCAVFQLLGLFLQRFRRLLWIMFTYLQPVYPEISQESSDARWTLCQTHLDFCLSFFFFPPTHTVTLHSCWWMQLKTCDLPKYIGGGWRSSDSKPLQHYLLQITKDKNEGIPECFGFYMYHIERTVWVICFALLCVPGVRIGCI